MADTFRKTKDGHYEAQLKWKSTEDLPNNLRQKTIEIFSEETHRRRQASTTLGKRST